MAGVDRVLQAGHPARGRAPVQISANDAARFLTQATFGATDSTISDVQTQGYSTWINSQTAMAPSAPTHLTFVNNRLTALKAANANATLSANEFEESFWSAAATAPDQLRQRMKLALSEIFVVSLQDPGIDVPGAASYHDMLGTDAFANYRTILQDVTLHPMMGV